jgi:hypothetical protein
VEGIQFAIVHGLSDNRFKRLDISDTRALVGYAPEDDLSRENPRLRDAGLESGASHSAADESQQSGIRRDL